MRVKILMTCWEVAQWPTKPQQMVILLEDWFPYVSVQFFFAARMITKNNDTRSAPITNLALFITSAKIASSSRWSMRSCTIIVSALLALLRPFCFEIFNSSCIFFNLVIELLFSWAFIAELDEFVIAMATCSIFLLIGQVTSQKLMLSFTSLLLVSSPEQWDHYR